MVSATLAIASLTAAAAVPQTLNYQGYLANAAGAPLNGSVSVTFSLYAVPTGGTALWTETQSAIPVSGGVFNAALGSVTAFGALAFDATYYLGVSVGGDAEMTPRQPLSSSPYALRAGRAEVASSADVATRAIVADSATRAVIADSISATVLSDLDRQIARAPDRSAIATNFIAALDSSVGIMQPGSLSIATGVDGLPIAAYVDKGIVWFIRCRDMACRTSDTPRQVDAAAAGRTAIIVGPDGNPVISFQANSATLLATVAWCLTPDCTGAIAKGPLGTGDASAMAVGPEGLLYIALTVPAGQVNLVRLSPPPPGRVFGTVSNVQVAGLTKFTGGVGLVIGVDGLPFLYGISGGYGGLAHCSNAQCSAFTFAASAILRQAFWIAMFLAADGRPVALLSEEYQRLSSTPPAWDQRLAARTCTDGSCTVLADAQLRDSAGYPAVAVGPNGLPVVAFTNGLTSTTNNLMIAKCIDVTCSALGPAVTLDATTASTGLYPSITVTNDGNPLIAYLDDTSPRSLKTAKCANSLCLNNFRRR